MGSKTKLVTTSIKDSEVKEDNIAPGAITTAKLTADSIESSEINDGTVTGDDLASTLDISAKTVTLPASAFNKQNFNISLLGFKMAVNENLTVFNLVDGIVDEFHDESGTDEAEGSNDNYCATSDFYNNISSVCVSAGFAITSITEPDTSTAGTNSAQSTSTFGTFTVPANLASVNMFAWGGGGGVSSPQSKSSGGGGYSEGTLAVTASQVLYVGVAEGGKGTPGPTFPGNSGGGAGIAHGGNIGPSLGSLSVAGGGGGGSGIASSNIGPQVGPNSVPAPGVAPNVVLVAAGGGGSSGSDIPSPSGTGASGGGGGLTGQAGGVPGNTYDGGMPAQTSVHNGRGTGGSPAPYFSGAGGGDQEQGGAGGQQNFPAPSGNGYYGGQDGAFLYGGTGAFGNDPQYSVAGGGGGGYYGGGGGAQIGQSYGGQGNGIDGGGSGGGSSYYGHPQVTSGSTCAATLTESSESGGAGKPNYVACTSEGRESASSGDGEDGYVFITGSSCSVLSTTIVSNAFTSTSVPTTSRIVVFEENVETPTLNTDIIASISRDNGSNFTTATLSDSGYVTGSSGQRILTGQATISGQPSGQSMRWKLALANKKVKIHGVSLAWA
jgi:hypothetical protein